MDFERKLKTAHDRAERKKELETRIKQLPPEIAELKSKWYVLKEKAAKESADVKDLEGKSVTAWLAKLTGKLEEQLERERKEAKDADRELQQTTAALTNAERWLEESRRELEILQGEAVQQEYEALLQEKRRAMMLRKDEIPEELQSLEEHLAHMESQLVTLKEAQMAAIAAEAAVKKADDTLSNSKSYMEFAGGLVRNPIDAALKQKADKSLDETENFYPSLMDETVRYRDLLIQLDASEMFSIPFNILDELRGPYSSDNFYELSDVVDKMRKLWAGIYNSLKQLEQLEEEIIREISVKKECWKQLVYAYQEGEEV